MVRENPALHARELQEVRLSWAPSRNLRGTPDADDVAKAAGCRPDFDDISDHPLRGQAS